MEFTDIPAAVIPNFPFKPTLHVNYQETLLPIKDGLPKMKDLPKEADGSGDLLAEYLFTYAEMRNLKAMEQLRLVEEDDALEVSESIDC